METLSIESCKISRNDSSKIFFKLRLTLQNQKNFVVKLICGKFDLNYVKSISNIFEELSDLLIYINQRDFKGLLEMLCNLMRFITIKKFISTQQWFSDNDYLSEIKKVLKIDYNFESIWLQKLIHILYAQIDLFSSPNFGSKDIINNMINNKLDIIIKNMNETTAYTFLFGKYPFYNLINSIICTIKMTLKEKIDLKNVLQYYFEIIGYILNLEINKFINKKNSGFLNNPAMDLSIMIYYIFYYITIYYNDNPDLYLRNQKCERSNKINKVFNDEKVPLNSRIKKKLSTNLGIRVENKENKENKITKKSIFRR